MASLIVRTFRGKRWYSIRESVGGRQKTVEWLGLNPSATRLREAVKRHNIRIRGLESEAAVNGEGNGTA